MPHRNVRKRKHDTWIVDTLHYSLLVKGYGDVSVPVLIEVFRMEHLDVQYGVLSGVHPDGPCAKTLY